MPRNERRKSSTGIYHIIARGIGQKRIFEQAQDYEHFLYILLVVKKISGVRNGSEFQRKSPEEQKAIILKLREERVPIRQIARVTGVSKGRIEYWGSGRGN